MKKRLHKLKKHLPKKTSAPVESPVYVGDIDATQLQHHLHAPFLTQLQAVLTYPF